jgi:hypothetical protein
MSTSIFHRMISIGRLCGAAALVLASACSAPLTAPSDVPSSLIGTWGLVSGAMGAPLPIAVAPGPTSPPIDVIADTLVFLGSPCIISCDADYSRRTIYRSTPSGSTSTDTLRRSGDFRMEDGAMRFVGYGGYDGLPPGSGTGTVSGDVLSIVWGSTEFVYRRGQ